MSVTIQYDENQRMQFSGLTCNCPCDHNVPQQDIYVGKGLLERIPQYIQKRGLGTHCVLVADQITYEVAGRDVACALTSAGYHVVLCVITRDGEMHPDETACGEVLLSIQPETEFLVSVGSGSITDTVRINATRTKLPFVCVGTAPSMDGYTSVVAPLLLRKAKIHRAGVCPEIIICDVDVLATAPLDMIASGVGDVLGKYIAKADWQISQIINDEPFCPTCGEIVTNAVNQLVDHAAEIHNKTEQGMRILIEALLLSGITIMIIGNTRAVASIEHNIAHYWEMKQLMRGKKPPAHGSSVGVSTLLVCPLFERFAHENIAELSLEAIKAKRISREERERFMLHAYGEEAGFAIMQQNPEDFITWEEQKRRIERVQARFTEIQQVIQMLPPLTRIQEAMQVLGAHMHPSEEGIDPELLALSMRCSKDYRSRYTLLKTIDECGLLEDYIKDYL